jgi:hypothetical protein
MILAASSIFALRGACTGVIKGWGLSMRYLIVVRGGGGGGGGDEK